MPKLSPVPAVQPTLGQRLAALQRAIETAAQEALGRAREAGELLAPLSVAERKAAAAEAGFSDRTARAYIQIAENWQRAASAESIRAALRLIGKVAEGPKRWVDPRQLWLPPIEWTPLPKGARQDTR